VPMPAGLVTHAHSLLLSPAFTNPTVTCPNAAAAGYTTGTSAANPSDCALVSKPVIANDIIFNNRPFYMTTSGSPSVVVLTPALSQPATPAVTNGVVTGGTGACPAGATYWDLGVYGDTTISGGNPHGWKLNPTYSILTSLTGPAGGYGAAASHNFAGPTGGGGLFVSMYCNGSRVPPEIAPTVCTSNANAPGCTYPGALGITVPPGVPDNNPFYANFTLTPAATVDEGNNWINMFYGPLTTLNPTVARSATNYNTPLGNYSPAGTGALPVNKIPCSAATLPLASEPTLGKDFYGNPRPDGTGVSCSGATTIDIGAVELPAPAGNIIPAVVLAPAAAAFGNVTVGTATTKSVTVSNPGSTALIIHRLVIVAPAGVSASDYTVRNGTCPIGGAGLAAGATCTAEVTFRPTAAGLVDATLNVTVEAQ
jgi:hypothetical protein